ncbi:hypothetical protein [Helcococcus bovis]|uniref:hypothetical protein n=1 Tax=Helcococcus bovis TaxID=3153252 RepID=UPI0038B889FC
MENQTKLALEKIFEPIYKSISERVKSKKHELNLTNEKILVSDPKIISRIVNNKRTKNNPYLVTDTSILKKNVNKETEEGIVPNLKFNSISEVLWGNAVDIEKYSEELFYNIIINLLDFNLIDNIFDNNSIEYYLMDYVPFAFYKAYLDFSEFDDYVPNYEHIFRILFPENYGQDYKNFNKFGYELFLKESINEMYKRCKTYFIYELKKFANETKSFYCVYDNFYENFLLSSFNKIITSNYPQRISFGNDIYNLLSSELKRGIELFKDGKVNELDKKLTLQKFIRIKIFIEELSKAQELIYNNL